MTRDDELWESVARAAKDLGVDQVPGLIEEAYRLAAPYRPEIRPPYEELLRGWCDYIRPFVFAAACRFKEFKLWTRFVEFVVSEIEAASPFTRHLKGLPGQLDILSKNLLEGNSVHVLWLERIYYPAFQYCGLPEPTISQAKWTALLGGPAPASPATPVTHGSFSLPSKMDIARFIDEETANHLQPCGQYGHIVRRQLDLLQSEFIEISGQEMSRLHFAYLRYRNSPTSAGHDDPPKSADLAKDLETTQNNIDKLVDRLRKDVRPRVEEEIKRAGIVIHDLKQWLLGILPKPELYAIGYLFPVCPDGSSSPGGAA